MSRSCVTHIYGLNSREGETEIMVSVYRHSDGNSSEQGKDLARLLTNPGFMAGDVEAMALQIVVGMSKLASTGWKGVNPSLPHGNIYLQAPGSENGDLAYIYHVYREGQQTRMRQDVLPARFVMFDGKPEDYDPIQADKREQEWRGGTSDN